jgi:uncharacterized membrane protein
MAVVVVLVASLLIARVVGALGAPALDSWPAATRVGLAVMFTFTALAHFNRMRGDLVRMVPPGLPFPHHLVTFTGVCEILGAIGVLVPMTRRLAGTCLVLLLVALFPANLSAARRGLSLAGKPVTPIWLRLPIPNFIRRTAALAFVLSWALLPVAHGANVKPEDAAQGAAGSWLALVDAGRYGESWEEAATYFKGAVTKKGWEHI